MADIKEKPMIGHKVRRLRNQLGITQTEMAQTIGVSASYLNLIEHNQRPVTVPLLFKLGQSFDVDLKDFAADDSSRLLADVTEFFADPLVAGHSVSKREMREFVNSQPNIAAGMMQMYAAFRSMKEDMQTVVTNDGERGVASISSKAEQMRLYLQENGNHFQELEDAAEAFTEQAGLARESLMGDLVRWLKDDRAIDTQVLPADVMGSDIRRYDPHRSRILLNESLRRPQRMFQLLLQVCNLTQQEVVEKLVADAANPDIAGMLRNQLAGYFAAAVMMPYAPFLDAARKLRHDFDLIGRRFGVSFEQVCHRLTTLSRAGEKGISFFFVRIDPAGNVSKRLSAGEMQFSQHGGSCARWIVHSAFRVPGTILTQVAELEEGQRVFTMARTVSPAWARPGEVAPEFAIGLGCDVKDAKGIVHADQHDLGAKAQATPIGIGCHVCERPDCAQRSQPPLGHSISFDPYRRTMGVYNPDA